MKKIKILISSLIVQVFVLILILINDFRCNSKLVIILLLSIYIIYNIKSLLEKYYLYKQDMENCPIEKVLKLMEVKRIYRTGTRNVANVPISKYIFLNIDDAELVQLTELGCNRVVVEGLMYYVKYYINSKEIVSMKLTSC